MMTTLAYVLLYFSLAANGLLIWSVIWHKKEVRKMETTIERVAIKVALAEAEIYNAQLYL